MNEFKNGLKDGIPIALGYFAVSFSFGILAIKGGLSVFQAVLTSVTNVTSAGQFAGLNCQALTVGLGGVVAGVLIVDAQHVTGGESIVQRILVDGKILVGADKAVDLGQLVILALFAFDAGNSGVEHIHRDDHRQRESDRHSDQCDGNSDAETDFFAHGFRWLLTK